MKRKTFIITKPTDIPLKMKTQVILTITQKRNRIFTLECTKVETYGILMTNRSTQRQNRPTTFLLPLLTMNHLQPLTKKRKTANSTGTSSKFPVSPQQHLLRQVKWPQTKSLQNQLQASHPNTKTRPKVPHLQA